MYGAIVAKISLRAFNEVTKNPMSVSWKVRDVTNNEIIYQGQSSSIVIDGKLNHQYNVAAKNQDDTWASVKPSVFVAAANNDVIAIGRIEPREKPVQCMIEITSAIPMTIKYRDGANNSKSFSNVTYVKEYVACGLITVAAIDSSGKWANILPSAKQNASPGTITKFTVQKKTDQPSGESCPVTLADFQPGCYGHLSICGQPTRWILTAMNGQYPQTNGSYERVFINIPCGTYMLSFSDASVSLSTSNPFEVKPGVYTHVKWTIIGTGNTYPTPTTGGGGGYYPYYPSINGTAVIPTEFDIWDYIKEHKYWFGGGAVVLVYFGHKYYKKKRGMR